MPTLPENFSLPPGIDPNVVAGQVAGVASTLLESEEERKRRLRRMALGMKKGGKVESASSRADGIAQRGKTRGVFK